MLKRIAAFLAAFAIATAAAAQKPDVFSADGAAIRGYDPVAYFTEAEPVKGKAEFTHQWNGATWRFANAANRERLAAAPEKYAPQYGGSCTMNMSNGVRRESDPHNWVISNGRLYVFAGARGVERFKQNPAVAAERAETNWKNMKPAASQ